ncbi:MAG TPA: ATP-dependent DNA ligase [Candidatus Limnocylindria bacterium]|nr:ATP-dependent DNA ligase [Candidatus Limnocylindria bacterium]
MHSLEAHYGPQVGALDFRYYRGAIHLPELNLWLDAHEPIGPKEWVFVSHAHSDHTASHARVLFSGPTQALMRSRVPGQREELVLPFGEKTPLPGHPAATITLLPAGHVLGSAMSLIEVDGKSLLYTGDFKMRRGLSAEPCEPRHADILIMETTYGLPKYVFPPTTEVLKSIVRFCREAIDNDEVPVLLGYSLGKSQEILRGLDAAGLPIMLHNQIVKMTEVYAQFGMSFPPYKNFDAAQAAHHVVLAPPGGSLAALQKHHGTVRSAILTGWALNSGAQFQYRAGTAFPLSDHADFPDLLEFVRQVSPREVHTLHGFATEFAATLRAKGIFARALGHDEQLELGLGSVSPAENHLSLPPPKSVEEVEVPVPPETLDASNNTPSSPSGSFAGFAETCAAIASTRAKQEKVTKLASYLRTLPLESLSTVTVWFTGHAYPASRNRTLQIGWSLLRHGVCQAVGISEAVFRQAYLQHGDTGEATAAMIESHRLTQSHQTSAAPLGLTEVTESFHRLSGAQGPKLKLPLVTELLRRTSGLEAKYLVKIVTGDLRIGLKEGLVEEAVALAFEASPEEVRTVNMLTGDIGVTAELASEKRLPEAGVVPLRPVKPMLASPEPSAAAIMERVAEWRGATEGDLTRLEAWTENKFDGIRCQTHKHGTEVALYSRDLKDITVTFPELGEALGRLSCDAIFDGEIVAMEDGRALPFAELQKRLGRRDRDLFLGDDIPVRFIAFDLLWLDGQSLLGEALHQRRAKLESLTFPGGIEPAPLRRAQNTEELELAFAEARSNGNEGLIIKDPASRYTPGRRGLAWLKLKKALATLDCVVVGAEYGHGKRKDVLSDYTFAVRDSATGELKTIGKAYSGLTDQEISALTKHFLASATRQRGRYYEVPPEVILEIAFDSIQASERHESGLAMRFPRIARIRTDKTVNEIDTVETARKIAGLPPTMQLAVG